MNDYCPYYHIDSTDIVNINQCWAIVDKTKQLDRKLIRHCGCEGDKKRCDFKKIGEVRRNE